MFCPNTGTKFRESYHLNHVIPRLDLYSNTDISKYPLISMNTVQTYFLFSFLFQLFLSQTTDI